MASGKQARAGKRGKTAPGDDRRFTAMQMKVFLDRYALKGRDLAEGATALVMGKQDPRRGQVVTVLGPEGEGWRTRLDDGGEEVFPAGALVPLLETSPTQMWDRVARAIARTETTKEKRAHWTERFRWALDGFKFVPGGRILAGAGSGGDVTFYNCFVIPSPHDSRRGIVRTLEQMIEIMARGGGVGINGSSLRPQGAYVRGVNGTSSGAVSWMEIYSDATGLIEQGGSRRGALMLMMAAWHPDIESFITVKRDFSRFNNANLSVIVPDGFMEAVERDGDWDLVFPDTDHPDYKATWDGDLAGWQAAGKPVRVYKTVRARDLWDQICESNWGSGEPGVVFLERYNKLSNTWYFQKIISVNPCFVGSTRLATDKGLLTFEELYRSQEEIQVITDLRAEDEVRQVVNGSRHTRLGVAARSAAPVFKTGENVPVYRLETSHGYEVTATANHRFLTPGGYVELRNLRPGDALYLQSAEGEWSREQTLSVIDWTAEARAKLEARSARGEARVPTDWSQEIGQFLGWAIADGYTYDDGGKPRLILVFGNQETELMPYFRSLVGSWFGVRGTANTRYNTTALQFQATVATFARGLGLKPVKATEKGVPEAIWRAPREAVIGFLQALFTADGTVNRTDTKGSCSIRLASSSKQLLQDVQLLLLNLGIVSALRLRRQAGTKGLPDGKGGTKVYEIATQYELLIDKANRDRFAAEIGFLTAAKQEKVAGFIKGKKRATNREFFSTKIVNIEQAGRADVYDTMEYATHSLIANGLVAHNCGEQGLPAWGVCNLGSLGLPAFVKDSQVDWDLLTETIRVAVRFLDNVIDTTTYIFDENREAQMAARRVGLGTQGLAHMLIRLGLRYGSPEADAFLEELYRRIMEESYRASVEIAREKGAFRAFDREKFLEGAFIKGLPADVREAIAEHAIRNATLLTQAPTGTTSLLAGMSSGIEPVFRFKMKRVDRIGEHYIYDPLYEEWEKAHPDQERPDYFVEADGLTPEEHVTVQALIQRFVDSSISKTVNAPHDHTVEDTKSVYELAYKLGCKGITYFRDGSRTGVLSEVKEEKKDQPPAAPAGDAQGAEPSQIALIPEVGGPRQLAKSGEGVNGAWGSVRPIDRPSRLEGFTDVRETPLGKLFLTLNGLDGHPIEVFAQIGKAGTDVAAFTEAVARLVSLALRCGVAPREVADQLIGIGGSRTVGFGAHRVRSVPDAIGQFLSEYLHRLEEGGEAAGGGASRAAAASPAPGDAEAAEEAVNGKVAKAMAALNLGNGHKHLSLCPGCGMHSLAPVEGCATCLNCGYSEC